MANLSDIFQELARHVPHGGIEDRRRESNDLEQLLRYPFSPERLAANQRYQERPITPMGRLSLDAGFWDMDRLPEQSRR